MRCITKRQSRYLQAPRRPSRAGLCRQCQLDEDVGTAAIARCRPVAVLDNANAGPGRDKGHGRTDIEGSGPVTASPAGVEHVGPGHRKRRHARRKDAAAAAISTVVSPFIRRATSRAAASASPNLPSNRRSKSSRACSAERHFLSTTTARFSRATSRIQIHDGHPSGLLTSPMAENT